MQPSLIYIIIVSAGTIVGQCIEIRQKIEDS